MSLKRTVNLTDRDKSLIELNEKKVTKYEAQYTGDTPPNHCGGMSKEIGEKAGEVEGHLRITRGGQILISDFRKESDIKDEVW